MPNVEKHFGSTQLGPKHGPTSDINFKDPAASIMTHGYNLKPMPWNDPQGGNSFGQPINQLGMIPERPGDVPQP